MILKIRSKSRLSTNVGVGYRTLGDDKTSMTGGNLFIDYDEDGKRKSKVLV